MLTDTALRNLQPREDLYKVSDRDGMYVRVAPSGTISFCYDYRFKGRRETVILGRYSRTGMTLALARQALQIAQNSLKEGISPAQEKKRKRQKGCSARTFGDFSEAYFKEAELSESTKSVRRAIYNRDIAQRFKRLTLPEIGEDDIRLLCDKIKARNAPATALQVRDLMKFIFDFAALKGTRIVNPAENIAPKAIATFKPRERALSPVEVRAMLCSLEFLRSRPDHRLAVRLLLLTLLRKMELIDGRWSEVDFESGVWSIPKERMKARRPHDVYLSKQALEILKVLKSCAGQSPYILPARHSPLTHIAKSTLNRLTVSVVLQAKSRGLPLEQFTLHDLRRTASTILNEAGFNRDWIEVCLAHETGHSVRGVYNKAKYAQQRAHMLQEWANMIDAWVAGKSYTPLLLPTFTKTFVPHFPSELGVVSL